jgi:mono/diheme cytochrome c family protein
MQAFLRSGVRHARSAGRPGPQHVGPRNGLRKTLVLLTPRSCCSLEYFRASCLVLAPLIASLTFFVAGGAHSIARAADVEAQATNHIHSITLPHFEPDLPMAPGRDDYLVVCVSCHSPRYVTMQPLFPQRQWEETVDKMAKVYGAQMDPTQRASIVQYLVATHGPGSAKASDGDDDSDFTSIARPSSQPETAPSLILARDNPKRLEQVERGAELFKQNCAGCHGTTGRGDGLVAQVLLRKPKNLTATRFSVNFLIQVLWNGKRGTAMPSWRALAQTNLEALAAYTLTLHQPAEAEQPSTENLKHGNQLFQKNCAQCHGELGDGKGPAAANLLPGPANFKFKRPDFDYIVAVLNEGIPGTAMPSWKNQISEPDLQALARFVRSLFGPVE